MAAAAPGVRRGRTHRQPVWERRLFMEHNYPRDQIRGNFYCSYEAVQAHSHEPRTRLYEKQPIPKSVMKLKKKVDKQIADDEVGCTLHHFLPAIRRAKRSSSILRLYLVHAAPLVTLGSYMPWGVLMARQHAAALDCFCHRPRHPRPLSRQPAQVIPGQQDTVDSQDADSVVPPLNPTGVGVVFRWPTVPHSPPSFFTSSKVPPSKR